MTDTQVPVLIGDIGGTNSRLIILSFSSNKAIPPKIIFQDNLLSFNFKSLQHILESFLKQFLNTNKYPKIGVLGIPGGVADNKILASFRFPDLNGRTGQEFAEIFNIKKFIFLNDFEINGYGLQCDLKEGTDYVLLDDRKPIENGIKTMIGAGTGLGMGFLTKEKNTKYYTVYSSGGGSQDFAPRNDLQQRYRDFIKKVKQIECPIMEDICCGSTLNLMFKFFLEEEHIKGNQQIVDQYGKAKDKQEELVKFHEVILKTGIKNECAICRKVVDLFVELYATIASNYSISYVPMGGMYLLGGISGTLDNYIKSNTKFREIFNHRNGLDSVLDQIPIYLVKNTQLGVKGAEEYARRILEEL